MGCPGVSKDFRRELLVHRLDLPADDASARVLRRLWPEVRREGIVEYKSPASSYAHRDLLVLLGYGCQHFSASAGRLPEHSDLLLALAVSHITPSVTEDIQSLGWRRRAPIGGARRRYDEAHAVDGVRTEVGRDGGLARARLHRRRHHDVREAPPRDRRAPVLPVPCQCP